MAKKETSCELMKCSDYKEGKCRYHNPGCKFQEEAKVCKRCDGSGRIYYAYGTNKGVPCPDCTKVDKMFRLEPFEVKGIATAAFLTCCSCGKTLSGMGGGRTDIICSECVGKNNVGGQSDGRNDKT